MTPNTAKSILFTLATALTVFMAHGVVLADTAQDRAYTSLIWYTP
jgi:hypothetical protein